MFSVKGTWLLQEYCMIEYIAEHVWEFLLQENVFIFEALENFRIEKGKIVESWGYWPDKDIEQKLNA